MCCSARKVTGPARIRGGTTISPNQVNNKKQRGRRQSDMGYSIRGGTTTTLPHPRINKKQFGRRQKRGTSEWALGLRQNATNLALSSENRTELNSSKICIKLEDETSLHRKRTPKGKPAYLASHRKAVSQSRKRRTAPNPPATP